VVTSLGYELYCPNAYDLGRSTKFKTYLECSWILGKTSTLRQGNQATNTILRKDCRHDLPMQNMYALFYSCLKLPDWMKTTQYNQTPLNLLQNGGICTLWWWGWGIVGYTCTGLNRHQSTELQIMDCSRHSQQKFPKFLCLKTVNSHGLCVEIPLFRRGGLNTGDKNPFDSLTKPTQNRPHLLSMWSNLGALQILSMFAEEYVANNKPNQVSYVSLSGPFR
jgi:hypothetical protein